MTSINLAKDIHATRHALGGADVITPVAVATVSRPLATSVGAGTMIYDSTLGRPIWSNGAAWRDASGTLV